MKEKQRILVSLISGVVAVLVAISLIYSFNTRKYKCTTMDNEIIKCEQIVEKTGSCWGQLKDGTLIQIKSYKEITDMNILIYLSVSMITYVVVYFIAYRRMVNIL